MIPHLPVGEAIPAAGPGAAALLGAAGLGILFGTLVATGMLKVYGATIGHLIRWLAGEIDVKVIRYHPFRSLSHALLGLDTTVRNGFAAAIEAGDEGAAWCFGTAAIVFRWSVRETADLARDVWRRFEHTTSQTIPRAVAAARDDALKRLRGIDATLGRIEAHARALEHRLLNGIDRIDAKVTHAIPASIAVVRTRVGRLERWERTAQHDLTKLRSRFGTIAFAGAVAFALERIFGKWIRCPSLRRAGKKIGCGGFSFFEDLLALSFEAMVASDLCQITHATQVAAREFVPAFDYLAEHIPGLLACQKASRPKVMKVRWYAPPPGPNELTRISGV